MRLYSIAHSIERSTCDWLIQNGDTPDRQLQQSPCGSEFSKKQPIQIASSIGGAALMLIRLGRRSPRNVAVYKFTAVDKEFVEKTEIKNLFSGKLSPLPRFGLKSSNQSSANARQRLQSMGYTSRLDSKSSRNFWIS
jgi:hypothetical protein